MATGKRKWSDCKVFLEGITIDCTREQSPGKGEEGQFDAALSDIA